MQWNPACSYVGKQEIQRSPLRVVSVENKRRASMGAYYYASNFNLNAVPYRDCHGGSAASELRVVNFQQREVPLGSPGHPPLKSTACAAMSNRTISSAAS